MHTDPPSLLLPVPVSYLYEMHFPSLLSRLPEPRQSQGCLQADSGAGDVGDPCARQSMRPPWLHQAMCGSRRQASTPCQAYLGTSFGTGAGRGVHAVC